MIGKYAVVRTYSAGVHIGTVSSLEDKQVTLTGARRLWYWKGAFTLSEVAVKGPGKDSKISVEVPEIVLTEAVEIILTTEFSQTVIAGISAYEP